MPHTCRAIVVHCMDFRFAKGLAQYVADQGLAGDADIVGWAGAGKAFLDDTSKEFALLQVELSQKLHGITEIHVINHIDCGAYGGRTAFADDQAERAKHIADVQAVRELIVERFPKLAFHGYIASLLDSTVHVEKVSL